MKGDGLRQHIPFWMFGLVISVVMVACVLLAPSQFQIPGVMGIAGALIVLMVKRPVFNMAIAVTLFLAAHVDFVGENESLATGARLLALVLLFAVACRGRSGARVGTGPLTALFAAGILAYLIVSSMSSGSGALTSGLFFAVTAAVIMLLASRASSRDFHRAAAIPISVALLLSLLVGVGGIEIAYAGGRLNGIFLNANTLGFVAASLFMLTITRFEHQPIAYFQLALAASLLLQSGSRSALAGVLVALVLALARRLVGASVSGRHLLPLTVTAGVSAILVLQFRGTSNILILRDNDSRIDGTEYALQIAATHGWRGIGFENSAIEVASTPMRWLAEGGYACLILVLFVYIVLFIASAKGSWQSLSVAGFGITSSCFEGWFLAGGSALFVIFWFTYFSAQEPPSRSLYSGDANPATDARLRRLGVSRSANSSSVSA